MNSVALDLGFFQINWYSIFMLIAILVGASIFMKETKKNGIVDDVIVNLLFWVIPLSIIGARIYYIIFNWSYYQGDKLAILRIWEGGLAIHGALIVALVFAFYYTRRYRINYLKILDMALIALIIGQAIGRWGNFFNQEAFGSVVSLGYLQSLHLPEFIISGMYINDYYFHPTFLYESIWCLIGFVGLIFYRRHKFIKIGDITAIYLIWYGIGRFLIEALRTDSLMLFNLKVAQLVSIVMIIIGVLIIFFNRFKKGTFDNLYHEGVKKK